MSKNDNTLLQDIYEQVAASSASPLKQEEIAIIGSYLTKPPFNYTVGDEHYTTLINIIADTSNEKTWTVIEDWLHGILNTAVSTTSTPTAGDQYIRAHKNSESFFSTPNEPPNERKQRLHRYMKYITELIVNKSNPLQVHVFHILNGTLPKARRVRVTDSKYDTFKKFEAAVFNNYMLKYAPKEDSRSVSEEVRKGDIFVDNTSNSLWLCMGYTSHQNIMCVQLYKKCDLNFFKRFISLKLTAGDETFCIPMNKIDVQPINVIQNTNIVKYSKSVEQAEMHKFYIVYKNLLDMTAKVSLRAFSLKERVLDSQNNPTGFSKYLSFKQPQAGDIALYDWEFIDKPGEEKRRPVVVAGRISKRLIIVKVTGESPQAHNSVPITDRNIAKFYEQINEKIPKQKNSFVLPEQYKIIDDTPLTIISRINNIETFFNIWVKILTNVGNVNT
jgi:hypothetical protein